MVGLSSGTWTVTLAADAIPPGYAAAGGEQRLEIAPGAAASVNFELAPSFVT
jgi:hypothetical protein